MCDDRDIDLELNLAKGLKTENPACKNRRDGDVRSFGG